MHVPEIDVYATFRCNLRCRHCFVGEALDHGTDLSWELLTTLLDVAAQRWRTRHVAFLGGEPTLYPHLVPAVDYAQRAGLHVRVVSNGGRSLRRFLDAQGTALAQIAVSVDGPAESHDDVRGAGSFALALESLRIARARGNRVSAIMSVGRHNVASTVASLEVLAAAGVDYVNIHYVTDRGFASADMVLSPAEWLRLRREVELAPRRPMVRFEGTFQPTDRPLHCAVRDNSKLMLFPDARVFPCTMYFGLPDGHAYTWDGQRLVPNPTFEARYRAEVAKTPHCPAIRFVSPSLESLAEAAGRRIGCIFDKDEMAQPIAPHTHTTQIAGNEGRETR